jgi:hypothetical protein
VLIGSTEKMASARTSRRARSRCTTSTARGARPISSNATAGSCARATRTPRSASLRYVVEGSFDAYSWQTVERKARFIAQVMRGRLDVREIEDIGDNALSFAEVKSLASGDPPILDKADAERTRLKRLQRAYQRNHHALQRTVAAADASAQRSIRDHAAVDAALQRRHDTRGELFAMRIGASYATTRPDATRLIQTWIAARAPGGIPYGRPDHDLGELGELGGLPIHVTLRRTLNGPPTDKLQLHDVPAQPATLRLDEVRVDALSLVRQLEHRLNDLPALADRIQRAGADAQADARRHRGRQGHSRRGNPHHRDHRPAHPLAARLSGV